MSAPSASNGISLSRYQLPLQESDTGAGAAVAAEASDWNEPLLRANAIWFCQLRWIVVAVLAVVGIAGFFPRSMAAFGLIIPFHWPLGTAILLAILNVIYQRFARVSQRGGFPSMRSLLWIQIVCDLVILTAVIRWVDQDLPAAPFMYLFHLILACMVFPPGESLLVAGLAAGCYLTRLALEPAVLAAPASILSASAAPVNAGLVQRALPAFVGSMLLIWIVIWYLVSRLAEVVRRRDRELATTNRRLELSGEERARHMLQTTHQLKAPFAAIHAQTQLLLDGYCGDLPVTARKVVERISARCLVLSRQIQEMLQLANLRSQGQTTPGRRQIDLGQVIGDVIARVEPTARQRGIRIEQHLEPVTLLAVADHLTMLLDNLVVNAVNYSHDQGVIQVTCRLLPPDAVEIAVRDHGIGIPREKLPRIFEDYYRTEAAVQHNRSSTGLGLAVVRQAARALQATIQVESAPGWGSRFTVRLPSSSDVSSIPKPQPR
jgi:two-component system, OmpR family, phosphate regulon sensor histidine kinase PhoR